MVVVVYNSTSELLSQLKKIFIFVIIFVNTVNCTDNYSATIDKNNSLSSIEGICAQKCPEQAWYDMKGCAKLKSTELRKHQGGTGGGHRLNVEISPLEQRILNLLGPTSLTGDNNIMKTTINLIRTFMRTSEQLEGECGMDCFIERCSAGCESWEKAVDATCESVCNVPDIIKPRELFCVMGCNDGIQNYFKWIRNEIGIPPAPALVADSLTATSLSLEWEIPPKFVELSRGKPYKHRSYLVQWRYEEGANSWKYFRNESMGNNSTIQVENLQPYTRYRFRIALLLSSTHDEQLVSAESVVMGTFAEGTPHSPPAIVRAVAIDHTRISVSWEPGPFPNGPIVSYVLQITDLLEDHTALKEIPGPDSNKYYIFGKLRPARSYNVSVQMRNQVGQGPAASTIVSTLTQPEIKDDETQPTLLLAAEYTILKQGFDFLAESSQDIYTSKHRITGMSIHIKKKLLFVSDEAGYVVRTSLEGNSEKHAIITPNSEENFKPLFLSTDWLNNHLYILAEVVHPGKHRVWQISRSDLHGHGLTIAIAGLHSCPKHIEVDPYNGYLFWLISDTFDSGLYRLDLGDISNGVKHEVLPLHLKKGNNYGAFTVDHTKFRILLPYEPFHEANTILAVSLDGKEEDNVRKNTQKPRFHEVKSLSQANGLFYWTNGAEVYTEEYHNAQNTYYHNAYPDLSNRTFVAVAVILPSAQPIPIPLNPPYNIQALLSSNKGKVSWKVPHLLGNQGKGAWQEWMYELEIIDDEKKTTITEKHIRSTSHTVRNLRENTNYTFRAAAYTSEGKGPKSSEFKTVTLKSSHNRSLIWSSNEGLLKSDIIGEHIEVLISPIDLGGNVTDMAWFDDMIFVVSNSSIKKYNQSTKKLEQFGDSEVKVDSIAIDWIGKRLYWSNKAPAYLSRGGLNGEGFERYIMYSTLRIIELKVDSINADFYYSTGIAVETCRLNGRHCRTYYSNQLYSGKQVSGLTLDYEHEIVYWIVRGYEQSSLLSAPMSRKWDGYSNIRETILQELSLEGPLIHFSNRLLWLQNDRTAIIGDLTGRNLAVIQNTKLSGLHTIGVIDPIHRRAKNHSQIQWNVIPDAIINSSIAIRGTWRSFNITWEPVRNLNRVKVFYELIIRINRDMKEETIETDHPFYHFSIRNLQPYTPLEVTIRAFTYWGSSPSIKIILHSPAAAPSEPSKFRVFLNHVHEPFRDHLNIEATLRWTTPMEPNGPIISYKVYCWYEEGKVNKTVYDGFDIVSTTRQFMIPNLVQNVTYWFRLQARTGVGSGEMTGSVSVHTTAEIPVPKLLVAKGNQIIELDLDLNEETILWTGNVPATHMTFINHEKRIFWINENNELYQLIRGRSYNDTQVYKLITLTSKALSLSVDWIERIIYWSQITKTGSSLYSLNINEITDNNKLQIKHDEILKSTGYIYSLQITPHDKTFYWIETKKSNSYQGEIKTFSLVTDRVQKFFDKKSRDLCLNQSIVTIGRQMSIDFSYTNHQRLLWTEQFAGLFSYDLQHKTCTPTNLTFPQSADSFVKDSGRFYWASNDTIWAYSFRYGPEYVVKMAGIKTIMAYSQQFYPNSKCLYPIQKPKDRNYTVTLVKREQEKLILKLPMPEIHFSCTYRPSTVKYTVLYKLYQPDDDRCNGTLCSIIETFNNTLVMEHLEPYKNYQFSVGINTFYGELLHYRTDFGPVVVYRTAPGAPSKPNNVSAEAISPTEAVIKWTPPDDINAETIWYEVHWQNVNKRNDFVNHQHQLVTDTSIRNSNEISIITRNLTNLFPCENYTIWVKAFTTNETFSESKSVLVLTFSEPDNITMINRTSYSLNIYWNPPANVSRYILQYIDPLNDNNATIVYDTAEHYDQQSVIKEFWIDNLEPKTQYKFFTHIYYPKRESPYIWPIHTKFIYETKGDRPTPPGKPLVKHVSGDVYQVAWEPSKENGATIEEYCLEGRLQLQHELSHNRVARSANNLLNTTQAGLQIVDEPEPIPSPWKIFYNGSDTNYLIKELNVINLYTFRVKSRNAYGWSLYSSENDPIVEPFMVAKAKFVFDSPTIILFAVFGFIIIATIVCIFIVHCRMTHKQRFYKGAGHIPDVELATLRNMPRNNNFIETSNMLYSAGPLNEDDIAALPQIKREQITIKDFLGSGAFGEVYEGCVTNVGFESELRVAIKTLRKGATDQEKSDFLKEAQLMSNFRHEHILRLIGVCLNNDTPYIIMELMQGGDLLSYLRQCRPTLDMASSLTLLDLISLCVDVASGCRYLEEMHFVHRDLACRNCLVSSTDPANRVVKIGDFGLARDIYKNDYYRNNGGLLPVRWMAPESLIDGVFSSQSDIWSFGVLCWEIMTLGQQPYPARHNVEVLNYVKRGGRPKRPTGCPEELYQIMLRCWNHEADARPTFRHCLDALNELKQCTNSETVITMQYSEWEPNGGIFNRTYLLADENHNQHFGGVLKFTNTDLSDNQSVLVTPTSSNSTTTSIIPKYLELLPSAEDEELQHNNANIIITPTNNKNTIGLVGDGYEMPNHDLFVINHNNNNINLNNSNNINNNIKLVNRTFSNSSTVSERSICSNSANLLNNNKNNNNNCNSIDNKMLKVVLPSNSRDECTSMEALLLMGQAAIDTKSND